MHQHCCRTQPSRNIERRPGPSCGEACSREAGEGCYKTLQMGRTEHWEPPAEILPYFPEISGNTVNGVGEADRRPPSPFFWHEPALQTHGELQGYVTSKFYDTPEVTESF